MITTLLRPQSKDPLYKVARPSLDLNFAKNKNLVDSITGRNLITFSRSSNATYVGSDGLIKTASNDAPRFIHNPINKESLGLLIEEQRTNVVRNSSDFSAATWVISANVIANATTAPNGTVTAQLITATSTGETGFTDTSIVASINTTYTSSCFVKQNTCRYFLLRLLPANAAANCWFDLQNGVVSSQDASILSATIVAYPNGWYRVSATASVGSSVAVQSRFDFRLSSSSGSTNNTSGQSLYMWGAQVEVGSFASSHISTAGSSATRSADFCSITGTNLTSFYNQNAGTTFVDFYNTPGFGSNYYAYCFSNSALGGGYTWGLRGLTNGFFLNQIRNAGITPGTADISYSVASTVNTRYKNVSNIEANTVNGILGNSYALSQNSVPGFTPAIMDTLNIGYQNGYLNNSIRRLVYWNRKLTQIQRLAL